MYTLADYYSQSFTKSLFDRVIKLKTMKTKIQNNKIHTIY